MIKFIVRKTIKDYQNTKDQTVREKYGILGGVLGIICNIFLFALKFTIGLVINAISIMSDAFNNLTDSFSSVVSIISAKLSNKKPDKDHPFGHGRIEYVATLIVAFVIMIVGVELAISSVKKFLVGVGLLEGEMDLLATGVKLYVSIGILVASLLVKLWMYSYNKYLGKQIDSKVLLASSSDSISDVLTSSVIIVSLIVGSLLLKDNYFYVDSIMSFIVSIIICINGIKIVIETIGDILGKPASKEEMEQLEALLTENEKILGIHDLIIHDYGPGRKFASVHAEVDANSNIVEAHEIIDRLEQICYSRLGLELTIHMDPIDFNSPIVRRAVETIENVLKDYPDISFHDLRITDGKENINVIFDLVVPFEYNNEKVNEIIATMKQKTKELDPLYSLVIKIDRPYIEH